MRTISPEKLNTSPKPTIAELAARLSLSKGTVSRILNDKGGAYSEETRNRVFAVAREIGYSPNPLARALATGKTGFVALWVQTLATSYHAQIAGAMEVALEKQGYQIAVTPFGRLDRNRDDYTGTPAGVDGVIAHEIYPDIWPLLFQHAHRTVPVVTTGILAPEESLDYVRVDLDAAAAEATRHLIATGRKRIAYVSNDMQMRLLDPRYVAYQTLMAQSNLTPECISLKSASRAQVRVAVREYIREHGCPGAMLCHNDAFAIAAYRALCDLDLRVPDDCALVGCDGIPDTEYLPVPLTTIVQPYVELCETACQFLQNRFADPHLPPQRIVLPGTLVIRASSSV